MSRRSLILVLGLALLLAGCEGTPTGEDEQVNYTLFGLAEINLDTGEDHLYLEFLTEGDAVPGSFVRVGNDTTYFDSWGTVNVSSPTVNWTHNASAVVTVYDTSRSFSHTISEQMPGAVSIAHFIPTNYIYQGGNVTVEWSGAPSAEGFLVTCVARTDGSFAWGFAENYGHAISVATIGPETFLDRYDNDRIADSFYVYIIAYSPTFTTRPLAKYADTPELGEISFPTSISGANITGSFCTAVVGRRQAFDVVAQE